MNDYVIGVIGTVLLCALFTAVTPEGKTAVVIKGIARLVCVLAILAPVLRFLSTGEIEKNFDKKSEEIFVQTSIESDKSFIQYYSEMRIRDAECALEEEIQEKYGVTADIHLTWIMCNEILGGIYSTEQIQIQRIDIAIPKEVVEEVKEKMRLYVQKAYCSEVYIE